MRPSNQRRSTRTAVVWSALRDRLAEPGAFEEDQARIVDIGGGTGGFAVPLAELGHRVLVVDPSPDALAALGRRAAEREVTGLVTGVQGDLDTLGSLPDGAVGAGAAGGADLVLCHGVLEVVADPATALRGLHSLLRPGGTLSLLVAQRHAAVVARAMAGHFQAARDLLDAPTGTPDTRAGRRYTAGELTDLLAGAGFGTGAEDLVVHAVRVFADLVPGSLLDLEPGATAALVELERAVAERPEYLPLATQVHLLARSR